MVEQVRFGHKYATSRNEDTARGRLQATGRGEVEPRTDVEHVARGVVYMASLPLEANVQFMTVMATKMPTSAATEEPRPPTADHNRGLSTERSPLHLQRVCSGADVPPRRARAGLALACSPCFIWSRSGIRNSYDRKTRTRRRGIDARETTLRLWQWRVVDAASRSDGAAFGRAAADHAADAVFRHEIEGAIGAALETNSPKSLSSVSRSLSSSLARRRICASVAPDATSAA